VSRTLPWSAVAAIVFTTPLSAQKASQTGAVSQEVFRTTISMQYDRPIARGRELFGALVPWGQIWTPGANRATWLDVSEPVTIEGQPLDAGRYGVWFLPREDQPWEVVLVSEWDVHHLRFPAHAEVARFSVPTEEAWHMEVLSFYFPEAGPYDATLRFHSGTASLPLRIEVGSDEG